jgi:predicted lipoprotein with Yx(FWY)xxD motif
MLKFRLRTALAAIALSAASVPYAYADMPVKTAATAKGPTLVDGKGMTLYIFAKDSDGKSACNGGCAANWPPLAAADTDKTAGDYTIIARDDGGKQWAYKGKPLYTWVKDTKPGDITGDGFLNGAWHVARP